MVVFSSCRHLIQILKRLPFCQHSNKHLCFIRDIILYFLTALMKSTDGSLIDIAVKAPILSLLTRGAVVDFYEEAKTTISLDHPNVVKCLGFSKEPNELPSLIKSNYSTPKYLEYALFYTPLETGYDIKAATDGWRWMKDNRLAPVIICTIYLLVLALCQCSFVDPNSRFKLKVPIIYLLH